MHGGKRREEPAVFNPHLPAAAHTYLVLQDTITAMYHPHQDPGCSSLIVMETVSESCRASAAAAAEDNSIWS